MNKKLRDWQKKIKAIHLKSIYRSLRILEMCWNPSPELLKLLSIGQPNMIITSTTHPNIRKPNHNKRLPINGVVYKLYGLTEGEIVEDGA